MNVVYTVLWFNLYFKYYNLEILPETTTTGNSYMYRELLRFKTTRIPLYMYDSHMAQW